MGLLSIVIDRQYSAIQHIKLPTVPRNVCACPNSSDMGISILSYLWNFAWASLFILSSHFSLSILSFIFAIVFPTYIILHYFLYFPTSTFIYFLSLSSPHFPWFSLLPLLSLSVCLWWVGNFLFLMHTQRVHIHFFKKKIRYNMLTVWCC